MSKPRHIAQAGVSLELIYKSLHLPDDGELINIKYDGYSGCVDLIIEHKDLPLLKDGGQISRIVPAVNQVPTGKDIPEYTYEVDWGV